MQPIISTTLEDATQAATHQARLGPDLAAAFVTDRGGRKENQDCCGYGRGADGSWVFAVADGLGGHRGGREAGQLAVQGALEGFAANFRLERAHLMPVFEKAQERIIQAKEGRSELARMRSTLVVLAIHDGLALWGHVGDVRLYHLRQGRIIFQTRDQSVPQMLVDMGEITPQEMRNHPDRSRLLHALGKAGERYRVDLGSAPVQLVAGDVLHLCSDGFWEWIEEDELQATLAQVPAPGDALRKLAAILRRKAPEREPEYDNYTALTVRVDHAPRNEAFWRRTRLVRMKPVVPMNKRG